MIIFVVLVILICWYFFAPIKWTFGLREPKNYQECVSATGNETFKQGDSLLTGEWKCVYKDKSFNVPLNPLLKN